MASGLTVKPQLTIREGTKSLQDVAETTTEDEMTTERRSQHVKSTTKDVAEEEVVEAEAAMIQTIVAEEEATEAVVDTREVVNESSSRTETTTAALTSPSKPRTSKPLRPTRLQEVAGNPMKREAANTSTKSHGRKDKMR
jgi:hypothetical protein